MCSSGILKNKIALISGGDKGIGKSIAIEFAKNGADVCFLYYKDEKASMETLIELNKYDIKAKAYKCDVADFESCKKCIQDILTNFGDVNILVNNAGITKDMLLFQMKENDFDTVIDTNLKGTYNLIHLLYKNFIKLKSGSIINISSVSGLHGNVGQAAYSASKAGIIGLTKTVARELGKKNVTCNAIAPGFIETEMTNKLNEDLKSKILNQIILNRFGRSDEVANVALFLAQSTYVTGQVIVIDGGLTI